PASEVRGRRRLLEPPPSTVLFIDLVIVRRHASQILTLSAMQALAHDLCRHVVTLLERRVRAKAPLDLSVEHRGQLLCRPPLCSGAAVHRWLRAPRQGGPTGGLLSLAGCHVDQRDPDPESPQLGRTSSMISITSLSSGSDPPRLNEVECRRRRRTRLQRAGDDLHAQLSPERER